MVPGKYEYDVIFISDQAMSHGQTRKAVNSGSTGFSFGAELATMARVPKKGEKTRIAIQVAVCKCLERVALSDLTIADICERAGVSHGTFYIYFSNRNALVGDVLMRFSAFIQVKMRQASKGERGRPARSATSAYMHLFEQNLGLMKCLLRHLDGFPEARTAFQNLNREWLETVVASTEHRLQQSGRPINHDELMRRAYALGGMIDQYLAGLLLDRDPNMGPFSQNREEIIDTLDLLWERGMAT
jgi:TetR/AcrR family transcriptional regulator, ethionamide resistance regulator